jgi:hypothetical protein
LEIPILSGVFTDNAPSVRISYPLNLVPIIEKSGINDGYLKPAPGIDILASTSGLDRGGINWNGVLYRVIGSKLFEDFYAYLEGACEDDTFYKNLVLIYLKNIPDELVELVNRVGHRVATGTVVGLVESLIGILG